MEKIVRIGFNGRPFCQKSMRGLGRHTFELIKNIHLYNPDVEIYVYCFDRVDDFYKNQLPFVKFRDEKCRPKIFWDLIKLPRDLKEDRIDLFHSTNNLGVPLRRPDEYKIVTTIHDDFTHQARASLNFSLSGVWDFLNYSIERFLYLRSDAFLTVSNIALETIVRGMSIPRDKIHVAYNGVSFNKIKSDIKKDYFLYVGGFEERKNLMPLLQAISALNKGEVKNKPLVLVGKIESASLEVRNFISQNTHLFDVRENVNDEELMDLYRNTKGLIFPSKKEGFGLPLIEAMRSGAAVIASDIPVFREIGGESCLYFNPDDPESIIQKIKLIQDDNLRAQLIDKGQSRSDIFTWAQMTKTVLKVYSDLGVLIQPKGEQ